MESILKELWRGNISPWENQTNLTPEMTHLMKLIERHRKDLEEQTDAKGNETIEKLFNTYWELESIVCEDTFCKGFSLGAKIVMEAFDQSRIFL